MILVSEIGDKTFFIAAILAMTNNKLVILSIQILNEMDIDMNIEHQVVFLAALSALYIMTIVSAALGWVVTTFIPRKVENTSYIYYVALFSPGLWELVWSD